MAQLWWVMFGLGAAIWVLVMALLFAALLRRRRGSSATAPDSRGGDTGRGWIVWGGIALPLVVLTIVFGHTIYTLAAVETPAGQTPVNIKIIARRWWWEVQYPDQGVETANEIHIPVGTPVGIELQAADVIHRPRATRWPSRGSRCLSRPAASSATASWGWTTRGWTAATLTSGQS